MFREISFSKVGKEKEGKMDAGYKGNVILFIRVF